MHLPIQPSFGVFVTLEGFWYAIPHSGLLPAVEAAGNRPPRTILLGEVAPRGSGAIYPEHGVYDTPMIGIRTAPLGLPWRQVWPKTFPLVVCQISSCHATSVPARQGCAEASQSLLRFFFPLSDPGGLAEARMQRDGHVYAALRHVEPRPVSLWPSEERFWSCRTGAMHDPASGLPRIYFPHTRVHKGLLAILQTSLGA